MPQKRKLEDAHIYHIPDEELDSQHVTAFVDRATQNGLRVRRDEHLCYVPPDEAVTRSLNESSDELPFLYFQDDQTADVDEIAAEVDLEASEEVSSRKGKRAFVTLVCPRSQLSRAIQADEILVVA